MCAIVSSDAGGGITIPAPIRAADVVRVDPRLEQPHEQRLAGRQVRPPPVDGRVEPGPRRGGDLDVDRLRSRLEPGDGRRRRSISVPGTGFWPVRPSLSVAVSGMPGTGTPS